MTSRASWTHAQAERLARSIRGGWALGAALACTLIVACSTNGGQDEPDPEVVAACETHCTCVGFVCSDVPDLVNDQFQQCVDLCVTWDDTEGFCATKWCEFPMISLPFAFRQHACTHALLMDGVDECLGLIGHDAVGGGPDAGGGDGAGGADAADAGALQDGVALEDGGALQDGAALQDGGALQDGVVPQDAADNVDAEDLTDPDAVDAAGDATITDADEGDAGPPADTTEDDTSAPDTVADTADPPEDAVDDTANADAGPDDAGPDDAGPDDAGSGDAGGEDTVDPPPTCDDYCGCMMSKCVTQPGFPFADYASCMSGCSVTPPDKLLCWTSFCVAADTVTTASLVQHACAHAWGAEGLDECEYKGWKGLSFNECIFDKCIDKAMGCAKVDGCADVGVCMAGCGFEQSCINDLCKKSLSNNALSAFEPVLFCAEQQGCF